MHALDWFFKCLDGSDILSMSEYSSHRISIFRFVSTIKFSLHVHIPSYITQARRGFLLFKWNRVLVFLVIHFILISYKSLESSWNFLSKRLQDVSFFSQYGNSMIWQTYQHVLYLIQQVSHFLLSCLYLHLILWIYSARSLTRFDNELAITLALSINCNL